MKANSDIYTWPISLVFGSLITLALFFTIPALRIKPANVKAPVIEIDFMQWREPVAPKVNVKPVHKPVRKPKRRPVVKELPKPQVKPKPKPVPVVKQTVIPEKTAVHETPTPTPPPTPPQPAPQPNVPTPSAPTTSAPTTPAQDYPAPTPIFQLTSLPRFAHKVEPQYPPAMRALGRESRVKVEALIDPRGRVRKVKILESGGTPFDQAAINALMASTFVPGNVEGKAVSVLMRIPIVFRLK